MTLIGFIFGTLNSAFLCDLSDFDNFLKCLLKNGKLLNFSSDKFEWTLVPYNPQIENHLSGSTLDG